MKKTIFAILFFIFTAHFIPLSSVQAADCPCGYDEDGECIPCKK